MPLKKDFLDEIIKKCLTDDAGKSPKVLVDWWCPGTGETVTINARSRSQVRNLGLAINFFKLKKD